MTAVAPIIEVRDVTFAYPTRPTPPAIQHATFSVTADDYLGIIGPNGGGKTTLLKLILGLLHPQDGEIRVLGQPPRAVRHRIGYVPQHRAFDANTPATALDIALAGRLSQSRFGLMYGRAHRAATTAALDRAGAADFADQPIATLSGGQRQRVLIARSLAADAAVLLLDEPMAGVDEPMQAGLADLLRELNATLPIVMVSHDVAYVSAQMKRIACVNRRVDIHDAAEVTGEVITEMYERPVRRIQPHRHEHDCCNVPESPPA